MKRRPSAICMILLLTLIIGCAMPVKMGPPPSPDMSHIQPLPYTAGLYLSPELKAYQHKIATSPFDAIVYPLGEQTAQIFKQCTAKAFDKVVPMASLTSTQGVDVIIKPTIVKFEAVIPMPAYNPYTATMVYQAEVLDPDGKKIFSQTATGDSQSSKGLMSGFSARSICADVAQKAMVDAARQVMEGVVESEELAHLQ